MKYILLFSFFAMLNGCAMFKSETPVQKQTTVSSEKLIELFNRSKQNPEYQGFTMEIASGDNEAKAIRRARLKLAQQIIVDVQSSTLVEQSEFVTDGQGQQLKQTQRQTQNIASSFTSVELEDAKTLERGTIDKQIYVIVGVKSDATERMRQAAKKRLSSLAIVNQISQTNDVGQRLMLAGKGLTEAKRMGVLDDRVVVKGMPDNSTFGSYFDFVIQNGIDQLSVALEKGEDFMRITVFERESLQPVKANLVVMINKQAYTTSSDGSVVLDKVNQRASLDIQLADKLYPLERFSANRNHSKLYLFTQPAGFFAEIYKNNQLLQTATTPEVLNVVFSNTEDNTYKVKFHAKDDFPGFETVLDAHKGYDVFVNRSFAPKTYGNIAIGLGSSFLSSDNFNYTLRDAYNKPLAEQEKQDYDQRVASGRYEVVVRHDSEDEKYQTIKDTILVQQDQTEKRRYFEPIDREYSRNGSGLMLGLRFGRTPSEGATIKSSDNNNLPDFSSAYEVYAGYEKYWTNLLIGGDLSLYIPAIDQETSSEQTANFGSSIYGGMYFGDGTRDFGFFNVGYSNLSVDGEYYGSYFGTENYEVDLSSAFAEVGYNFGNGFRLSYRYFPSDIATGQLTLTMGASSIDQSYKYPASVKARKGKHYESF